MAFRRRVQASEPKWQMNALAGKTEPNWQVNKLLGPQGLGADPTKMAKTQLNAEILLAMQRGAGNVAVNGLLGKKGNAQSGVDVPALGVTSRDLVTRFGEARPGVERGRPRSMIGRMRAMLGSRETRADESYAAVIALLRRYEAKVGTGDLQGALNLLAQTRSQVVVWLREHPRKVGSDDLPVGVGQPEKHYQLDKDELLRSELEHLAYRDVIVAETIMQNRHAGFADEGSASGGSAGSVSKMRSPSGERSYFKSYAEADDTGAEIDPAVGSGVASGFTTKAESGEELASDPRTGLAAKQAYLPNRAVATAMLDEMLGTGLIPATDFAVVGDRFGTMQKGAQGVAPMGSFAVTGPGGGRQDVPFSTKGPGIEAVGSSPESLRAFSNLELLDVISGQQDRHPGNFLLHYDPATKRIVVSGIDNDVAFSAFQSNVKETVRKGKTIGLPTYVDDGVITRALTISPQRMKAALERLLPPAEVDATVARWTEIRQRLESMDKANRLLSPEQWAAHKKARDQVQVPGFASSRDYYDAFRATQQADTEVLEEGADVGEVSTIVNEMSSMLQRSGSGGGPDAFDATRAEDLLRRLELVSPSYSRTGSIPRQLRRRLEER